VSRVSEYNGVVIDYTRDRIIPEQGLAMLTKKGFYKKPHENSPQESYARAATSYCFGDYDLAQRIYDAVSTGWFTFASPVLSNAGDITWPDFDRHQFHDAGDWLEDNVDPDGMPISCFLSMIPDSKEGLVQTRSEAEWLSMMGGGVGVYAGNRSPDERSTGVMAHLRGYDADTLAYRQTATRRGSMAAFLDIDHPEIKAFISMRNPIGGDQNKKCFNLNNGVMITDSFMEAVVAGNDYELVDPKHGATGTFLDARTIWEELLELRFETGEPYMIWKDTINRNLPKQIMHPLYQVRQSNLCSEVVLMTSAKRTAVCCLSSLNLEKYDEWKDTTLVADLLRFLDNVLEYFIRLAPKTLERAVRSARKERAIGIGTLGWHSYLQKNSIPFESGGFNSAAQHTSIIYKDIKAKATEASKAMAGYRGEAPDTEGSGYRNSHFMAIAPNASSSSLVGASPSVEPFAAVAYVAQGRAGSFLIKNKYFREVLKAYDEDTREVWDSVISNAGSVQHLTFLTYHERLVFKTAREINPQWIIELASIRQKHICQSQSINLFVNKDITLQEMSDLHMMAWKKGLKSLYYCRAEAAGKVDVGTGGDKPLNSIPVKQKIDFEVCISCEG
jgi:ribonucleoside-diphosphate reductase alpha chain